MSYDSDHEAYLRDLPLIAKISEVDPGEVAGYVTWAILTTGESVLVHNACCDWHALADMSLHCTHIGPACTSPQTSLN